MIYLSLVGAAAAALRCVFSMTAFARIHGTPDTWLGRRGLCGGGAAELVLERVEVARQAARHANLRTQHFPPRVCLSLTQSTRR